MIVANLPFTWTLLRRIFKLNSFSKDTASASVPYHSSRTARGRNVKSPQHGRHASGQNGTLPTGKQGSHNSSIDMRQMSPTIMKAPELPKPVQRASWREQGVFGREDIDVMASDPWDFGNDSDVLDDPTEPPSAVTRRASVSTAASPGRTSPGSGSPGTHRLSRIRDEEAQYALEEQVGGRCQYHEGPGDYLSSSSSVAAFEELDAEKASTLAASAKSQNSGEIEETGGLYRKPSPIIEV